jgi:hypothetical protein
VSDGVNPATQIVIMLPQTAVRVWGLNLNEIAEVHQAEYPLRHPNDKLLRPLIYEINERIMSACSLRVTNFISIDTPFEFENVSTLIDCQVINLLHQFPKWQPRQGFRIIDYASAPERKLQFHDTFSPIQFARALIRCRRFSAKFSPIEFMHFPYRWSNHERALDIFWKNSFLNLVKFREISSKFLQINLEAFPELIGLDKFSDITLILPHSNETYLDFISRMSLILQDKYYRDYFYSGGKILVKQHRHCVEHFPPEFTIQGVNFFNLSGGLSKSLPAEVLLVAYPKLTLISAPSSSLAVCDPQNTSILGPVNGEDRKHYSLLFRRLKAEGHRLKII